MKTIVNLICAATLMSALCAVLVACNEPKTREQPEEPEVIGVTPVPASDIPEEVTAFFEENLSPYSVSGSGLFFVDEQNKPYEERIETICLMVNRVEELKAIMFSSVELPPIDFDKYTLIIGYATMPGTGFTSSGQSLDTKSNSATLNLRVKRPEGSYAVLCPLYYWGLYPKFSKATIEVNVIYDANINYEK